MRKARKGTTARKQTWLGGKNKLHKETQYLWDKQTSSNRASPSCKMAKTLSFIYDRFDGNSLAEKRKERKYVGLDKKRGSISVSGQLRTHPSPNPTCHNKLIS